MKILFYNIVLNLSVYIIVYMYQVLGFLEGKNLAYQIIKEQCMSRCIYVCQYLPPPLCFHPLKSILEVLFIIGIISEGIIRT